MRKEICVIIGLILVGSTACGLQGDSAEDAERALSGNQTRGPLPADADLGVPPAASLSFASGWSEFLNGPLYQGARISVSVDPSRFPTCGTVGEVSLGMRAEDGTVSYTHLTEGTPGNTRWGPVTLPVAGSGIEVWLKVDDGAGCVEWDSAFGDNYRFPLAAWRPVRLTFGADWSETLERPLRAGDSLVIDYDWARLPQCRVIYRGFPGWDIIAHLRFDDQEPIGQSTVGFLDMTTIERRLVVVTVPEDAHHLEIWFENDQYPPTCKAWDSDYGRNYQFDIQH